MALVQEPNTGNNSKIYCLSPPLSSVCRERAWAAVIININRINYWPIDSVLTRDVAAIAIPFSSTMTVFLASGYLNITVQSIPQELQEVVDLCRSEKMPLIMGNDSNAHSTLWGKIDTRGELVENWLMRNNIYLVNRGCVPTFVPLNGSRATIIDLTIVNEWAYDLTTDWQVDLQDP